MCCSNLKDGCKYYFKAQTAKQLNRHQSLAVTLNQALPPPQEDHLVRIIHTALFHIGTFLSTSWLLSILLPVSDALITMLLDCIKKITVYALAAMFPGL